MSNYHLIFKKDLLHKIDRLAWYQKGRFSNY